MEQDLEPRRRALAVFYQRYVVADHVLRRAQSEAVSWFPQADRRHVAPIGDAGSPVRELYERRQRALSQLTVARIKLHEARRRRALRRRVMLIASD